MFQQVIGIPMRTDPVPFVTNLFLFDYEGIWIGKPENLVKYFQSIDDLAVINGAGEFKKVYHYI